LKRFREELTPYLKGELPDANHNVGLVELGPPAVALARG
jgi:hypothetical protein